MVGPGSCCLKDDLGTGAWDSRRGLQIAGSRFILKKISAEAGSRKDPLSTSSKVDRVEVGTRLRSQCLMIAHFRDELATQDCRLGGSGSRYGSMTLAVFAVLSGVTAGPVSGEICPGNKSVWAGALRNTRARSRCSLGQGWDWERMERNWKPLSVLLPWASARNGCVCWYGTQLLIRSTHRVREGGGLSTSVQPH